MAGWRRTALSRAGAAIGSVLGSTDSCPNPTCRVDGFGCPHYVVSVGAGLAVGLKREAGGNPALPRSGNWKRTSSLHWGALPREATTSRWKAGHGRSRPEPEDLPTAARSTPRGDRPASLRGKTAGVATRPRGGWARVGSTPHDTAISSRKPDARGGMAAPSDAACPRCRCRGLLPRVDLRGKGDDRAPCTGAVR